MKPENLYVTDHAVQRWRERVAVYGDAPKSEVAEAVRAATPLSATDPTPFTKLAGTRYYRMAGRESVYFVTDMRPDGEAVVTVIDVNYRAPVLRSARKKQAGGVESPPPLVDEPDFPDVFAQREWLQTHRLEAQMQLSRLTRGDFARADWVERYEALGQRLAETRSAWREARRAKLDAEQQEIYREDGGINHNPAIRFLLAEVARLSEEVCELKARLAPAEVART